jgi:hypothetical protein
MSALLMTVVFAFLLITAARHAHNAPSPEVLAGALTLFSAIQAGRIEHPDRSTLRGMLSAAGNWLIVASILPTVVLAVALAFSDSGWIPVAAAAAAIAAQLLLQLVMWRGPLSSTGSSRRPPRRQLETQPVPDYARTGVLQSDWWRSTTADALKIGRHAHAYVVWEREQYDGVPSLLRLLCATWQPSLSASLSDQSQGRRLLWLPGRHALAASTIPLVRPGSAISVTRTDTISANQDQADGADDGEMTIPGRPANILALLRAGMPSQALTFVVFREQPDKDWARNIYQREIAQDPDRLAPQESVLDIVEILLSVPRQGEPPALACHPLAGAMAAAADHRLKVLDAQLPVPPPSAAYTDRTWARLRVGLRDAEICRLPTFLQSIRKRIDCPAGRPVCDVWVRTAPECPRRVIVATQPPPPARQSEPVLASDLDVIAATDGPRRAGNTDADHWRVMAICANARAGIESDVLSKLGKDQPQLCLAGLTYAVLHGTAIT